MKDLNAGFLLDIWHDLKEKKLAPVAIGLVVALIAIPTLLMNGSDDAGEVPLPTPIADPADQGAKVVVAEELAENSKLDSYEARDPFKGLAGGGSVDDGSTDGTAAAPIDDKLTGSTGGTTGSTGSTDIAGTDTGTTGLGDSDTTGGSDGGSAPDTTPPVKKDTAYFNFRLDIKFGKPGREKRTKSMSRLSFLKVSGFPVALFLGVDESERSALFLVTPGLNHQGEGECIPTPTNCDFLSLGIGKEHYLSANDREFRMELLDINRVKASVDKQEREVARRAAERRAQRGGEDGGVSGDGEPEPYEWPLLVDGAG